MASVPLQTGGNHGSDPWPASVVDSGSDRLGDQDHTSAIGTGASPSTRLAPSCSGPHSTLGSSTRASTASAARPSHTTAVIMASIQWLARQLTFRGRKGKIGVLFHVERSFGCVCLITALVGHRKPAVSSHGKPPAGLG